VTTPPIHAISIFLLVLSVIFSSAAVILARGHLLRISSMSSGQTPALVKKLARLPAADRLVELRRQAAPSSVEWRVAEEALGADEAGRAAAVDSVLADVQLELEARSMWPRAATRIAGASGVLLMALELSFRLEVIVAVILLLTGIFSAIVCMMIERRVSSISTELRRNIDALVDVLELRSRDDRRHPTAPLSTVRRPRRRQM
jgi:biopolymer transport protein ExbB/TolQ